jgi:L-lactate utilization protein LutC
MAVTSARDTFLHRVRQAVAEGNRGGAVPPLPDRGAVGYQGAGSSPLDRLAETVAAAGGQAHLVSDGARAVTVVLRLVHERLARRVLLGGGAFIDSLGLQGALTASGVEVLVAARLTAEEGRAAFFGADVGITGVDFVVAETGTLVLATRPDQPRSASLLPPIHIAVAHRDQVVPDLFDLFGTAPNPVPACLTLITGPSKTGDIELKLVTGVHGPGELHLVLVTG